MYKSFIICLSKISSSLESATALKDQLEAFNMPAELFEGTYGNDAVKIAEDEGRVYSLEAFETVEESLRWQKKSSYPGVIGCFYSHYRLWEKCIELDEPIIIWEDDVTITRPFEHVEWNDVLILSLGFEEFSRPYKQYLESTADSSFTIPYQEMYMPGATGYAIKPHAARKLVDRYKNTFLPADVAINGRVLNIELHSKLMGVANTQKVSLTKNLKFW